VNLTVNMVMMIQTLIPRVILMRKLMLMKIMIGVMTMIRMKIMIGAMIMILMRIMIGAMIMIQTKIMIGITILNLMMRRICSHQRSNLMMVIVIMIMNLIPIKMELKQL
jgi:hypothetical protein